LRRSRKEEKGKRERKERGRERENRLLGNKEGRNPGGSTK
jgi:hypothetical protein